jgi:hypothetical protein
MTILKRLLGAAGEKLRGHFGHAPSLKACGGERRLVGLERAVIAGERDAVRIAGLELNRVGVARPDDDGAPVIEGRVERENRRLVPAVQRRGARERGGDLIDQRARGPERTRRVEKLLELRRRQSVARRRAEDDGIRPTEVVERSFRYVLCADQPSLEAMASSGASS